MTYLITGVFTIIVLIFCFFYFIKQSKFPSGFIGRKMMRLWNKIYLPMVKWSLNEIDISFFPTLILDVGTGNGASTNLLYESYRPSSIYGIDISETAIKEAKNVYQSGSISFELMNINHLRYKDDTFDFVTAFQTHFHWKNLELSLIEIKRILVSGGKVIMACETNKINIYTHEYKNAEEFRKLLDKLGFKNFVYKTFHKWTAYYFQK